MGWGRMSRRHDFRCDACGKSHPNVVVEEGQSVFTTPFYCGCGAILVWIPKVGRMDALEPFQRFEVTVRDPATGGNQQVTIDSLHKLRQVERESEQRARNGEGQPLVWRDYSQDASNRDVHTLGTDPSFSAADLRKLRAAKPVMKETFTPDAAPAMGSGAHEISPLDGLE